MSFFTIIGVLIAMSFLVMFVPRTTAAITLSKLWLIPAMESGGNDYLGFIFFIGLIIAVLMDIITLVTLTES